MLIKILQLYPGSIFALFLLMKLQLWVEHANKSEAARLMEQHVRNVQRRIEKIVFDS